MKIIFISKRRPQQRDLISRPYGRFYHLPVLLAERGHNVSVVFLDFKGNESVYSKKSEVQWISIDFKNLGFAKAYREIFQKSVRANPDWIIGLSDTWPGIIAAHIAKKCGARLGIDAYDNYESYMPWNLPLHLMWRHSLGNADLITAAGPHLARLLGAYAKPGVPTEVIPMSADPAFFPMEKSFCRKSLGLPQDAPLLGYYGSWAERRGTGNILEIFDQVKSKIPNARLVLSGNPPEHAKTYPGVINLGYLDDQQLPLLVNAIDVACILTRNSRFGKYSYPAKLCEAIACRTKVVATDTAPVRWMLENNADVLVPVDDTEAFSTKVIEVIGSKQPNTMQLSGWNLGAEKLDQLLRG